MKIKWVFFGLASASKNSIVGNNWLVGWLIGNAVFSEMALKDFSDFLHEVRGL